MTPGPSGARSTSEDARARRTRERLVTGYVELTQAGGVPTVSEVVRAAGVNPSSFYAQFRNLGELTLYVLDSTLTSLYAEPFRTDRAEPLTTADLREHAAASITSAVRRHREPLRAVVRHDRPRARQRIGEAIARNNREVMGRFAGWSGMPEPSLRLMLSYLAYGWSGVLCAWLADEIDLEPEALAAELVALNPDGARYLATFGGGPDPATPPA